MSAPVAGRSVVVTGAGGGIGRALALEAAGRGASVVVALDIELGSAEDTAASVRAAGGKAVAFACDITDDDAVFDVAHRVLDTCGVPGLVCANAGVGPTTARLLDIDLLEARWVMDVNVVGTLATLQAFGRALVASSEGGWMLATASEHALGAPHPGMGIYTGSKHAVLGMCDIMRRELPDHVGLSVLCPGLVPSDLWRAGRRRQDRYGGSIEPEDTGGAQLMARGLPAEELAQRTFDGLARGQFLIPTHFNARAYAEDRHREVTAAFDALAASGAPEVSYDVREIGRAMRAERES